MADISIIFSGAKDTETESTFLEVFYSENYNKVSIVMKDSSMDKKVIITLNRETAIRFHRELKKQISFINQPPF